MSEYKCSGLRAVVPIPPAMASTSVEIEEAHEKLAQCVRVSVLLSHLDCGWMDRGNSVEPAEVGHVERKDASDSVDFHRCCQARIMSALAGDAVSHDKHLPLLK